MTTPPPTTTADLSNPVWQLVFFLLLWQSLYKISNVAISGLLKFLKIFVHLFGGAYSGINILEDVPSSTDGALKFLGLNKDSSFITYVVCPNCDSIYSFDDCVISRGMTIESKCCKHIAYPNHPQASRRKECGSLLLRKVKAGKRFTLIPIKAYPYQPLCTSLGRLVQREGFVQTCEQWRQRKTHIPPHVYGDVYDGKI